MKRWIFTLVALSFSQAALAGSGGAPPDGPVMQDMMCRDAIAYFQKHHRISIRIMNTNQVVPFWAATPLAEAAGGLDCTKGKKFNYVYFESLDSDQCVIGARCGATDS